MNPRRRLLEPLILARFIVDVVEDRKAEDIVLLDLRPDAIIADHFVICNGTSDRQLRALTDHVREAVKERFGLTPHVVDGQPDAGWVLVDYGDVILHIFLADVRAYYDIEGLWRKQANANVLLSIQ